LLTLFIGTMLGNGIQADGSHRLILASNALANRPVFVSMFGYTGNYFLPQTQLNITSAQTIQAVKNISRAVGKGNLNVVSVVGEEPYQPPWGWTVVNWNNKSIVSAMKKYVLGLSNWAAGIYARLDLEQFNYNATGNMYCKTLFVCKSNSSLYSQVRLFVTKLKTVNASSCHCNVSINGLWLDHAPNLYNCCNQSGYYAFNHMMQNLTGSFPGMNFLINEAAKCPIGSVPKNCSQNVQGGWVAPLGNDTWQSHTYVTSTVKPGTYNQINNGSIIALNTLWNKAVGPGRVLLHFDSDSLNSNSPMGYFANQTSTVENTTIANLTTEGETRNANLAYGMIFPIFGGATCNCTIPGGTVNYHGTFYDSLTIGTYQGVKFGRGTAGNFIKIMAST